MTLEKTCVKCGLLKPFAEFYADKSKKDGLRRACKPCLKKYNSSHYEKNAESIKAAVKAYSASNSEKIKERLVARSNVTRVVYARWYAKNAEKKRAYCRSYRIANPEVFRAKNTRRRARQIGAGGNFTAEQLRGLYRRQRGKCACCREGLNKRYHADHIEPLARGGSNGIENIQLLCPTCNLSKSARDPLEFMQSRGFLL